MTLEKIVGQAAEIAGTYGRMWVAPARVDKMTRAMLYAESAREHLRLFAEWCYQALDGHWINILPDGQLPPGAFTPWGGSGKSKMPKMQRWVLRQWLIQMEHSRALPPWYYIEDERRWYVDLIHYPALSDVLHWLDDHPISPRTWLKLWLSMPKSQRKRAGKQAEVRK